MSSYKLESPRLHISNLPVEMFEYIVNFLPLRDRKSVSLVSRLWCQQAFSFSGMAYLKMRIYCNHYMVEKRDLDVLRTSVRPYRNLVLYSNHQACSCWYLAPMVDVLTRLGPTIESLNLKIIGCNPQQLEGFVARMPNVKQITINVDGRNNKAMDPEQTAKVIKRYERQLRHLELFAWNSRAAKATIEQLNLSQLHTLELCGVNCNTDEEMICRFFKSLPVLRTAILRFHVTSNVLKVICVNCPKLGKLIFRTDGLSGKLFCYLEQLKYLRALFVNGYIHRDALDDCKPLESVQFLSITSKPEASIKQLSHVFPTLRTLQVNRSSDMQMDNTFVQEISHNFNQLKGLTIDTIGKRTVGSVEPILPQYFRQLIDLSNLQELTLCCMRLATSKEDHDCLLAHLHRACCADGRRFNLKRLKLKNCDRIEHDSLMDTLQIFPVLQYLEVSRCRMITSEDMQFTRKLMPECVIHFVEYIDQYSALKLIASKLQLGGFEAVYG